MSRCRSGADDSDSRAVVYVRDHDDLTIFGLTDRPRPRLAETIVRYRDAEGVLEYGARFFEGHAMLLRVRSSLASVPPEFKQNYIPV
jgi:hypothetical protein